jgi:hypothetical protein
MKNLLLCALAAVLLLSCRSGPAAVTNVTAIVTFTNVVRGVTNGDTITINGSVRRYTNGVLNNAALWIQSTNVVGHGATNTWLHLAVYTPAGVDSISPTNTNSLVIVSTFVTNTALTATLSAGVGTVTYSTNPYADVRSLVFPNDALPTPAARTNNVSGLIGLLNDNRQTNSVNNGVTALSNLIDRTSSQGLGNKAITNSSLDTTRITNAPNAWGSNFNVVLLRATNGALYGFTNSGYIDKLTNGAIYYVLLVGATNNGFIGALTNGYLTNTVISGAKLTNAVNYRNAFSSPGTNGAQSEQFGAGAVSTNAGSLAVGAGSRAYGSYSTVLGYNAIAEGHQSIALGSGVESYGGNSIAIGTASVSDATNNIVIGVNANGAFANSIVIGNYAQDTATNQIVLGAANVTVVIPGNITFAALTNSSTFLLTGGQITNSLAYVTALTNQSTFGLTNGALGWSRLEGNTITNAIHDGTNRWNGDVSFTPRANANPVNGNNANVNIGTNVHVQLSGPTTIGVYCGFLAGRDGDYRLLRFTGAITNTLANESGFEGTAAQRILTGTGGDVAMTNNPSFATLIYDATASRWRVVSVSR